MKTPAICAALLLLGCCAFDAAAKDDKPPLPILEEETPDAFQPVVDQVRTDMESGGRYEYIHKSEREDVNRFLDQMMAMIRKAGTVAAMKEEEKVELFNTQEKINAILLHNDNNRMICSRAQEPGALFYITTCHTYAEIRRRQLEDQNTLEGTQNHVMIGNAMSAGPAH
jgi:hypothetical protein